MQTLPVTLGIRISQEDADRLKKMAEQEGVAVATLARRLLRQELVSTDPVEAVFEALESDALLRRRLHRILVLMGTEP